MDKDSNRWNALAIHYNGLSVPIQEGLLAQGVKSDFLACDNPSDSKLAHKIIATDGSQYDFILCGCNLSDEERASDGLLSIAKLCDERAIPCIVALPRGHSHILIGLKFRFWVDRDSLLEPLDLRVCFKGDSRISDDWGNVFKKTFALASESCVFDWDAIVTSTARRREYKNQKGEEFVINVYKPKIYLKRGFYTFGKHDDPESIETREDPDIGRRMHKVFAGKARIRNKIAKQDKKEAIKTSLAKRHQPKIVGKGNKLNKYVPASDKISEVLSTRVSSSEEYVRVIKESSLLKRRKRIAFYDNRLKRSKAERRSIKKKKILERRLARAQKKSS